MQFTARNGAFLGQTRTAEGQSNLTFGHSTVSIIVMYLSLSLRWLVAKYLRYLLLRCNCVCFHPQRLNRPARLKTDQHEGLLVIESSSPGFNLSPIFTFDCWVKRGKSPQTKLFCMYGKQDSTILTPGPKAMLIGLHMIYFFRDSY